MRRIAIINQKGGVGKTTTAVNLSAALAASGERVVLVDLDPQAHASLHLGYDPTQAAATMYDVLAHGVSLADIAWQAEERLTVMGSHIDLAAAEIELAGVVGRELILRDRVADLKEPYDYLIIDCPPSLGILTLNALCAVDEVFLPLQPHFLALHGLSKLLETVDLVGRRLNDRLHLSGVVLCLFESGTRLAAEVTENVHEFFDAGRADGKPWSGARIFEARIRRNIRLAEAPSFGQSIFAYAPDSNGAADYRSLADEVLAAARDADAPCHAASR